MRCPIRYLSYNIGTDTPNIVDSLPIYCKYFNITDMKRLILPTSDTINHWIAVSRFRTLENGNDGYDYASDNNIELKSVVKCSPCIWFFTRVSWRVPWH